MHDPDRVEKMRDDIDRRSGEGRSQSAEEAAEAALAAHRAAQLANGYEPKGPLYPKETLEPKPPQDNQLTMNEALEEKTIEQEIHELDQQMSRMIQEQLSHSKNPHAMKMVWEAEQTGEPLFCFRARDFFSIQVLVNYANIVEDYGPDNPMFLDKIVDAIGEFKEWQKANVSQVRYPD